MSITPADLVNREVLVCVSSLVSTLAQGQTAARPSDLRFLCEQAAELSYPIDDYEESAREAGWQLIARHRSGWQAKNVLTLINLNATSRDDAWREVCEDNDLEPYAREVFEHWAITNWLGSKLQAHGERVDFDFQGLIVWARTTTGQAISADSVIEKIVAELNAA